LQIFTAESQFLHSSVGTLVEFSDVIQILVPCLLSYITGLKFNFLSFSVIAFLFSFTTPISYNIKKGSQCNPLDERILAFVNNNYLKLTLLKLTINVDNVTLAVVT
jgi:hypothetical protein